MAETHDYFLFDDSDTENKDPSINEYILANLSNSSETELSSAQLTTPLSPTPWTPAMSQWAKVQQDANIWNQMKPIYQSSFSMEVRYYLCHWIEEQNWDGIDEHNVHFTDAARHLLKQMVELLHQKAGEMTSQEFFVTRVRLEENVRSLLDLTEQNPLELVRIIKELLATEKRLILEAEQAEQQQELSQESEGPGEQQKIAEKIMHQIGILQQKTKSTDNESKKLQEHQESFIIQFSDSQKITAQQQQLMQRPDSAEKKQMQAQLQKQREEMDFHLERIARQLLQLRMDLAKKYEDTISCLQELQKEILDNELIAWKRRQQLAGNGLFLDSSHVETLQGWCEALADLIWQNRQQIKKSTQLQQQLPIKLPEGGESNLPKLNDNITGLLSSLVTSTFIVETQPPQVLKKDARFGAVVRLLVGGKLNVHMNPPQVKATIISESQAKDLLRNDVKAKNETSGEILNNFGVMEHESTTGKLSINFRNMQLKKIKRSDKKGTEAVTEEKFCILFQSEFNVGGNELVFQVWTLSLPVVVTVHGNQECNATATVLWDNAFAEAGRVPFTVPDNVDWKPLADQLSMKFMSQTGKGLSETNLSYIASKLFGSKDPTSCSVTWSMFNKDTLLQRQFTFWEWFYNIQKLTKEHLKDLWTDDAIIGFISKSQAQEWLSNKSSGTFLLRFSDSEMGGITVAWTGDNGEVWNLAPFTAKDFSIRGLADRIQDLHTLVYLHPDKHKDTIFSKYYTPAPASDSNKNPGDYIRPELRTTIPEFGGRLEQMSQPFSPVSNPGSNHPNFNPNDLDELPELNQLGPISQELSDLDLSELTYQMTDQIPDDIYHMNQIEEFNPMIPN